MISAGIVPSLRIPAFAGIFSYCAKSSCNPQKNVIQYTRKRRYDGIGRSCLRARSRSGSDSPPDCHSLPSRRFAACETQTKKRIFAGMMELADVRDSKSRVREDVRVRPPLPAPNSTNPNPKPIGEGFGFVVYFDYPNFNFKQRKQNEKRRSRK